MNLHRRIVPASTLIRGCAIVVSTLLCAGSRAAEPETNSRPPVPVTNSASTSQSAVTSDDPRGTLALEPIAVSAAVYKLPQTRREVMKIQVFFDLTADFGWPSLGGDPFVLTPGRLPQRTKNVAATASIIDTGDLRSTPSLSLAGALLSAPEFSLPGRPDESSSKPSRQGAALRGLSVPMLLDGVPCTDPFDGRVVWAQIPRTGLARAELVPGGGASVWGNGTLGGVVQFLTLPPKGEMVLESGPPPDGGPPDPALTKQVIHSTAQLAMTLGGLDTQSAEFVTSQPTGRGVLQILGQTFHTDGFFSVGDKQKGPIDRAGWSRTHSLAARWRQPFGKSVEAVATFRDSDETFGSGTPHQHGSSRESFASVTLAGSGTIGFAWNALAYFQRGSSANSFSAVNADRKGETPLIDQFAVPSAAFGASWSGAWRHQGDSRTSMGVDFRAVRGEARQNGNFENGDFAHQLVAGGKQSFGGIYVLHDQVITSTLRATLGARIDRWDETDGHRREIERATDVIVLDEKYSADHGLKFNPSLGAVWQATKAWRGRIGGQHSFRRPTLNERYVTFGNGSVVTLANPHLRTERTTSLEISTEYSLPRKPTAAELRTPPALTFEVKVFFNELRSAVGNIGVAGGSPKFPFGTALPSGYRMEKRINLSRARVQGGQFSTVWRPSAIFTLQASVLFNEATIVHSTAAPLLVGKLLTDVPHHTARLAATWRMSKTVSLTLRVRSIGRMFADLENTLPLGDVVITDIGTTYSLNSKTELYLSANNLADTRVEADRSSDGLAYLGSPRIVFGGLRLKW